jgi:hypothetical protein
VYAAKARLDLVGDARRGESGGDAGADDGDAVEQVLVNRWRGLDRSP